MNDDQLIRESAARLFADHAESGLNTQVEAGEFPSALWQQIEEAGFPLALVQDERGFGLPVDQVLPIFEELGRHRLPTPLAETAVAQALLAAAGQTLPLGPGTLIDDTPGNTLTLSADGRTLSGHVQVVPWGRHAQWAVAQLPNGNNVWLSLKQPGCVRIEPHNNLAGLPSDTLHFEAAAIQATLPTQLLGLHTPVRAFGALVHAAMMLGAMEWVLSQAITYANDRVQFGRPIGRNQALQQMLAQTSGDIASARMAVRVAGLDLQAPTAVRLDRSHFGIAVAKTRCGEAASRTAATAHQVLGAIGFTHEHPLHFATRRLWAWREAYGADAWWAQQLGEAAIRAGATAFWPAMTQRGFVPAHA